ncbi:dihydropyrimidinase [uncultured Enterovirga sp.]|uniref:dihydropyrimidinase n=1 Tax=uncultured Enterovirga sp. TaxID=2026352 RepID=UPI0035CB3D20
MRALDLVIRGGTVVTGTDAVLTDVGVSDGLVTAIGRDLGPAEETVDATGMLVMPGGVDSHVHLDQPPVGAEMCDGFDTGTASAAAGGTTTVVAFAWQTKGSSLLATVADYHQRANQARVDYAFHMTITDPTPTVLKEELPLLVAEGNRSIKIFLTYDGVRVDDAQAIRILAEARRNGALVCVHAEHHDLLAWLTEQLVAAGLTAPKYHPWAKPMVVEREAVHRIIALAEALDVPIQVFHVSGAESAEEIARAQARGLKVWGETCPQYLVLTAEDLDRPDFEGAKFVFGPPARTKADQEALWRYMRRGVIEVVSSDHSPTRFDATGKKIAGENAPFHKIPNGIPGLAARLPVLFTEGVSKGRIDVQTFVRLVSTNPARLFGLHPRKGTIAVGSDADVVIFDPHKSVTLTNAAMHHGGDFTPYEGYRTQGYPVATYLRGKLVFDGQEVVGPAGQGRYLARDLYPMIEPLGRFTSPFNPVDRILTR